MVIPVKKRKDILAQLHFTHQGIEKTRLAAKEAYFWPGIASDIKSTVEGCESCQKFRPSQPSEPFQSVIKDITFPLELVSTDIYEISGKHYLVIADAYSGFVEVKKLRRIVSADVIAAMDEFFSLVGYPTRLRSDNGRQLVSEEAKEYLRKHGVAQETSSPEFPSSNGHAESAVKVAKSLQKKCIEENKKFQPALAELRRQPRSDGEIPSDLFFRRKVRGHLVRNDNLEKEITREKIKVSENAKAKELQKVQIGQIVRVQNQSTKTWERKAKVIGVCEHDRSYKLQDVSDQKIFRRNRIFIKPVKVPGELECDDPENNEGCRPGLRPEVLADSETTQQLRRSERLKSKLKAENKAV